MRIDWYSQKGQSRERNCDAASYCETSHGLAIGLVDASERQASQQFAHHWAKTIVSAAVSSGFDLGGALITAALKEAQAGLRETFLHQIASYSLVVINRKSGAGAVLSVGDCLVGVSGTNKPSKSGTNWLNTPHTAEAQLQSHGLADAVLPGAQHLLTRSINARRFHEPDIHSFRICNGYKLILATDGYWREYGGDAAVDLKQLQDDASYLALTWGESPLELEQNSDMANLLPLDI
ncbi:MAG: hypothetical protein EA349_00460 [Halomonadaceae bacterium]|nr:MAG: hypothetical protein EA349_00460 [Halomonadaceae bacterium]